MRRGSSSLNLRSVWCNFCQCGVWSQLDSADVTRQTCWLRSRSECSVQYNQNDVSSARNNEPAADKGQKQVGTDKMHQTD